MADRFDTTRWSLVVRAALDGAGARVALEALCRTYRPPVLAYVRARRRDDAEDVTQAFFLHVLKAGLAGRADPGRGLFRAFLLTALRNFLADDHDRATTARRGGGTESVPVHTLELGDEDDPERVLRSRPFPRLRSSRRSTGLPASRISR